VAFVSVSVSGSEYERMERFCMGQVYVEVSISYVETISVVPMFTYWRTDN